MSESRETLAALLLGASFIGSILFADDIFSDPKKDHFENTQSPMVEYPTSPLFYGSKDAQSNNGFVGVNVRVPQDQNRVNLNSNGSQLLAYQLYQQAVNAATPTQQQLNSISGQAQEQTGVTAEQLKGGVSSEFAPYATLDGSGGQSPLFSSEFQAVNIENSRANSISACAQNKPNFIATSLLPKPEIPGQKTWDIGAPQNVLATQNFLSATQQIGTDTILSSNRNASRDIRNTIPNPISIVSPWMNTTITPDLERRPLDCFIPNTGLYGCGPTGCNTNGTYVNQ
jgi:hypothetical protein